MQISVYANFGVQWPDIILNLTPTGFEEFSFRLLLSVAVLCGCVKENMPVLQLKYKLLQVCRATCKL